jgi:aspartate-semialdehyde dehydrogenase
MKLAPDGYRVAVVGASSLLGRELLAVLEERGFPVSRLVRYEAEDEEPELPILDLRENFQAAVADQDVSEGDLDFVFLAAAPQAGSGLPRFLRPGPDGTGQRPAPAATGVEAGKASAPEGRAHCIVIDLAEALGDTPGKTLSVPFLERGGLKRAGSPGKAPTRPCASKFFVSPHPAAILISSVLLRLAARFALARAVAQVFEPVSEIGPRAIEELQNQTVNLLTFQKIPRQVFGDQLAFNLLPRLRHAPGALTDLEKRLRRQLREYLSERAPLPAVRLFQVPVFYSFALSLYVETEKPEPLEALAGALAGEPIHVRRLSQPAPSQVEATGSGDILVDTITADAEHPAGAWIWAVADNMRLAALNAVAIAERFKNGGQ